MISQLIAIYDIKAHAHFPPVVVPNLEVAIRHLSSAANDPNHQVYKHPEDFQLFHLGTYDDTHATIELLPTKKLIATALQLKRKA